jgi:GNAT superfamily N-acetyltransferase
MEASYPVIRLMQPDDIEGAMRLKTVANWNQTSLDWERLLRLEPNGCFIDEREGTVVGTTTALRHGTDLSWIGMVLVLPAFRRKGIARGLVQHAMTWLRDRGHCVTGLDATEMGRPLYEQLGFRDEDLIERWERAPVQTAANAGPCASTQLHDSLLALDRMACGYDRSALIHDLASDASVECVQRASGFAFGRPGSTAWHMGPCVAGLDSDAESLLVDLLAPHAGERVFWDLVPSSSPARRLARRLEFRPARRLTRMLRNEGGSEIRPSRPAQIYATAGFEFG